MISRPKSEPIKILVCIDNMATGGAARVATMLINGLVSRGYDIYLETDLEKGFFYDGLPDSLTLYPRYNLVGTRFFDKIRHHWNSWRRHLKSYRACNPDIVITFSPRIFLNVFVATRFIKGVKIIASDHTAMDRDLGPWINFIRHKLYSCADAVTILTEKDSHILGSKIPKKIVIPNPLPFKPFVENNISRQKTVLIAGRLDAWDVKGIDRIIEIWSRVSPDYPDWILEIAGPGTQDSIAFINKLIKQASLENTVRLIGYRSDLIEIYRHTSIFALPSRIEGFPIVLMEAMSQGCACVSFSMRGAISEIITDEEDGFIIPDGDLKEFEKKLRLLIDNECKRNNISSKAITNIARFSPEQIIDKWEALIQKNTSNP